MAHIKGTFESRNEELNRVTKVRWPFDLRRENIIVVALMQVQQSDRQYELSLITVYARKI